MARILFGGQPDAGFCIVLLSLLYPHLDGSAQEGLACIQLSPLAEGLEATRHSGDPYSLLLPCWLDLGADGVRRELGGCLAAVAADVNGGRCRVVFDYSNETAWPITAETIAELARGAGISALSAITLVSQNRLLEQQDLPIRHLCADAFLVSGWDACRRLLEEEALVLEPPEPQHDLLCLNATPRWIRLLALLKLAQAGLLDLQAPDHDEHCQIPYISFAGIGYGKGAAIDLADFRRILAEIQQPELLEFLEPLLARTPLRVDNLGAQGNDLAMQIDLHHYRNSRLSLVTETGMEQAHRRITEKTLKPLALGQPCVTIGHPHALECARELGYATYDDCLDNRYDSVRNWLRRMEAAIASAGAFLRAYADDPELRQRVRATNRVNRRWTRDGFARHYHARFGRPLAERITWADRPG